MLEYLYFLAIMVSSFLLYYCIRLKNLPSPYDDIYFMLYLILNLRFYYYFISIFTITDQYSRNVFLAQLLKDYFYSNAFFYCISFYLILFIIYFYTVNQYSHTSHDKVLSFCGNIVYVHYWLFMVQISNNSWVFFIITSSLECGLLMFLLKNHDFYEHEFQVLFVLSMARVSFQYLFPRVGFEAIAFLVIEKILPPVFETILCVMYFGTLIETVNKSFGGFLEFQSKLLFSGTCNGRLRIRNLPLVFRTVWGFTILPLIYTVLLFGILGVCFEEIHGLRMISLIIGVSIPCAYLMMLSLQKSKFIDLLLNTISFAVAIIIVKEFV